MSWLRVESSKMLHLDTLRIAASLAVVVFHWRAELETPLGGIVPTAQLESLSFAVDLFFIISGVVMFEVYSKRLPNIKSFARFLQKRIARLYPLHLATFIVIWCIGFAGSILHLPEKHPDSFDPAGIAPTLLLLGSFPFVNHLSFNRPSWSISAEMGCYLLLPVVLFLQRRNRWLPVLATVAGIILLVQLTGGWDWTLWTYHYGCIRAILPFSFGVALGGAEDLLSRIRYSQQLLALSALAFAAGSVFEVSQGILMACIYAIAVFAYAADVNKKAGRIITWMAPYGSLTYSIYMIHGVYSLFAFSLVLRKLHLGSVAHNAFVVLNVVPLLFLSYLSLVYFETPARRWISELGSQQSKAAA